MTHKWEPVEESANNPNYWNIRSAKLDVPGGTLHRTVISRESVGSAPAMTVTFVPEVEPLNVLVTDEDLRRLTECKDAPRARALLTQIMRSNGLELTA